MRSISFHRFGRFDFLVRTQRSRTAIRIRRPVDRPNVRSGLFVRHRRHPLSFRLLLSLPLVRRAFSHFGSLRLSHDIRFDLSLSTSLELIHHHHHSRPLYFILTSAFAADWPFQHFQCCSSIIFPSLNQRIFPRVSIFGAFKLPLSAKLSAFTDCSLWSHSIELHKARGECQEWNRCYYHQTISNRANNAFVLSVCFFLSFIFLLVPFSRAVFMIKI